jgi:hypothetical protein
MVGYGSYFHQMYRVAEIVTTFFKDKAQASIEDELEQVGGNADDDIGDAVSFMREREILFGSDSLLARYGPLLAEICTRNKVYTVSSWTKPLLMTKRVNIHVM